MVNIPTTPDGTVTGLAVARAARNLSCSDLATPLGVTAAQVSAWERGVSVPSRGQLAGLALRLGWAVGDLECRLSEGEGWSLAVRVRNRMVRGLRPRV